MGDLDGDGFADLLLRHASGANAIWFMNGMTIASSGFTSTVGAGSSVVASGDFNDDGMADVMWRYAPSGQAVTWLMDATSIVSSANTSVLDTSWTAHASPATNGR